MASERPGASCAAQHETAQYETVRSALNAAFGSPRVNAITPIAAGASGAFPFRVEIGERRYLVRVEGPASPLRNPHQYASMRIAAEAGIAPRLHWVDEAVRVAVMDFIEEQPLSTFPGGRRALARSVGEMLRRVQATSPFPHFIRYPDMVSRLWAWVCRTGLFAPGVLDPYTERLGRLREAYAWEPAHLVSSHNDPVPRNILFDGNRLWMIDWESAYCNDPLVDVAITLDSFARSPALEGVLLEAWSGGAPDDTVSARLAQVRALTRLYYAGVFLSASASANGPLADGNVSTPSVAAFQSAVRDGRLQPGAAATRHILGKMYLAAFFTGAAPPGLDAAV